MKTIITLMMLSSIAFATDECTNHIGKEEVKETLEINTKVPSYLEGATILIKLKNGKELMKSAKDFKVVPRKQQFIVTKTETNSTTSCTVGDEYKKNRVSVLGGYGRRSSLTTKTSPGLTEVETQRGFVGGLQYQRMLNKSWSVGIQGQTNKTGSLLLGLDF